MRHFGRRATRIPQRPGAFALAVLKGFRANQGVLLAGAVAYYTLLSLVPCSDEPDAPDRAARMCAAVLEPLCNVHGVSRKVLSMALADLLLGGDPDRERWAATGASMVAIDTVLHNFLHRTGILRRFEAEHAYGPLCYGAGGCAEIIEGLAGQVDARAFNSAFPAYFPRFVQHAIWRFCAQAALDICNGNRIDDRARCENRYCPAFEDCERVPLGTS